MKLQSRQYVSTHILLYMLLEASERLQLIIPAGAIFGVFLQACYEKSVLEALILVNVFCMRIGNGEVFSRQDLDDVRDEVSEFESQQCQVRVFCC